MSKPNTLDLVCPACRAALLFEIDKLTCAACHLKWPVHNGVPEFISEAPYWGELPENKMENLLAAMDHSHWHAVLRQSGDADFQRVFSFIANCNRANWQYLLEAGQDKRALDIGAGMGTIAHALSYRYGVVYALEQVPSRIEFMRRRFQQDNVRNINLIRGSFNGMPFPDNFFDLIVLNGVLEWLPAEQPQLNPATIQLDALRKTLSLLRPGGYLYVGIENRLHYYYFIGAKDPHCAVPYVTILPRPLANWINFRKTGTRYLNYLYSARGYRRLLSRSGYRHITIFDADSSYNFPSFITPIHSSAYDFYYQEFFPHSQKALRRFLQACAYHVRKIIPMQYAFIILAEKP